METRGLLDVRLDLLVTIKAVLMETGLPEVVTLRTVLHALQVFVKRGKLPRRHQLRRRRRRWKTPHQ